MPAITHFTPTPSFNNAATKVLTARSTSTTTAPPDHSARDGKIIIGFGVAGFVLLPVVAYGIWFCGLLVLCMAQTLFRILRLKKLWDLTFGPRYQQHKQRRQEALTSRENAQLELHNRGYARQAWARKELILARKDGRQPNLSRDVVIELERLWKDKAFRFHDLPAEIRLQIYSEFDYRTALRLMRVNKFFYFDKPATGIDREQRAAFIYHAETFWWNEGRLACYGCLKLREKGEFEADQRTDIFERYADEELERRCFDCQVEKGAIAWPRWRRFVRSVNKHARAARNQRRRRGQ